MLLLAESDPLVLQMFLNPGLANNGEAPFSRKTLTFAWKNQVCFLPSQVLSIWGSRIQEAPCPPSLCSQALRGCKSQMEWVEFPLLFGTWFLAPPFYSLLVPPLSVRL